MITVLLVDDHDLVRMGIRRILEDAGADQGLSVVADTGSGEEAVRLVREHQPDIVIMDANMPGMSGLESMQRIRQYDAEQKIVFCSAITEADLPRHLLENGANGYMTKGCDVPEMVQGLKKVHQGKMFLSSDIQSDIIEAMAMKKSQSPLDDLSDREMQILTRLAQGQRTKDMAEQLHLSPKTVSTYKSRLQTKLEAKSDADLVKIAIKYGLIQSES